MNGEIRIFVVHESKQHAVPQTAKHLDRPMLRNRGKAHVELCFRVENESALGFKVRGTTCHR